jgi:hypothetical protein
MDRVSMGSPLSPFIANFFMEDFEGVALSRATYNPHVGSVTLMTFVIWPCGPEKLKYFLNHFNKIHPNIQFTMETELNGHLPSLDIDICRRQHGSLGAHCIQETHLHQPVFECWVTPPPGQ